MISILIIFIVLWLYLNFVASYHLANVDTLTKKQKIYQAMFTWFLPILGAIFIISFHLSDKSYVGNRKSRKGFAIKTINIFTFLGEDKGT